MSRGTIVLSGGRVVPPEVIGFEVSDPAHEIQGVRFASAPPLRTTPYATANLHADELTLVVQGTDASVALQAMPQTLPDWSAQTAFPEADHDATQDQIKILMESVRMGGIALSVGVVWWASRVTGLIGSLLASMPAWRHLDPLPIVGRDDDEDEREWNESADAEADADELAVSMVFETSRSELVSAS
jgi:hypothetical protein